MARTADYLEIASSSLDKEVIEHIGTFKGRVYHAAENSLNHLVKAKMIANIDPEMAVFRALTAEEEAATALFSALKRRGYKNSEKLNFKDHRFKAALYPFLTVIHHQIIELPELSESSFTLFWASQENEPRSKKLGLRIRLPHLSDSVLIPDPPLEFQLDTESGVPLDFKEQIEKLAKGIGKDRALDHIKELANLRNLLLYAGETGRSRLKDDVDKVIEGFKNHVFVILRILCLIYPYDKKALFAQQCLNNFLLMMEKNIEV